MKPVIYKEYKGNYAHTKMKADKDLRKLSKKGYTITDEHYEQGRWKGSDFILALILCLLVIGFLIFIYMLICKPSGTRTVTFTRATA